MSTFYTGTVCPFYYKKHLVNWAVSYFKRPKSKYNKMKKQQLYAIWYKQAHLNKW
jgi:hypothetical protein